jgi:antitoxin component YwqK of YwqJK toxin-antitoxin module
MKYKEWMKLIHKHPCKDLNGTVIAYDSDGTPLGEVIFKEGKVILRRVYATEEKRISYN